VAVSTSLSVSLSESVFTSASASVSVSVSASASSAQSGEAAHPGSAQSKRPSRLLSAPSRHSSALSPS
jgi:hypothetical protein